MMDSVSLFHSHRFIMNPDNDFKSSFAKCRTLLYGKMYAVTIESSAKRKKTFDLGIFLHYLPLFRRFSPTKEKRKWRMNHQNEWIGNYWLKMAKTFHTYSIYKLKEFRTAWNIQIILSFVDRFNRGNLAVWQRNWIKRYYSNGHESWKEHCNSALSVQFCYHGL